MFVRSTPQMKNDPDREEQEREKAAKKKEELEEQDDEETTRKARQWDEWKDGMAVSFLSQYNFFFVLFIQSLWNSESDSFHSIHSRNPFCYLMFTQLSCWCFFSMIFSQLF